LITDRGLHRQKTHPRREILAHAFACALFLLVGGSMSWAQADTPANELILAMIRIVLDHNPTLASQQVLVRESANLPEPPSAFALTGVSVTGATSFWDPDTNTFRLFPALTIGTTFSLSDPTRLLNTYNLKKEREQARQEYEKIRTSLISDVISTVKAILGLGTKAESLAKLKAYLEDYSDLVEKQVRAGTAAPDPEKLWDLKERIVSIATEMEDVENELRTTRLEAAMRLGGDAWEQLLDLLMQLGV
jgi:outer membrane protein TolC